MEKELNTHEHNLNEEQINTSFQKQQKIVEKITGNGIQSYYENLDPKLKKEAFREPKEMVVACIDEGCTHHAHKAEGPILNLAGSGILYPVEHTVDLLKDKDIAVITSHDGCGAASIAGKDPYTYTAEVVRLVNEYRAEKGMSLVKHEHIPAENMTRSELFHEATAIYYNFGENLFDATRVQDADGNELLPKGFTIDRGHFSEENSLKELGVSIDIAFGDHGFGERFTKEQPLVIVFVASKMDEEQERALAYIQSRKEFQDGKIVIDYLEDK